MKFSPLELERRTSEFRDLFSDEYAYLQDKPGLAELLRRDIGHWGLSAIRAWGESSDRESESCPIPANCRNLQQLFDRLEGRLTLTRRLSAADARTIFVYLCTAVQRDFRDSWAAVAAPNLRQPTLRSTPSIQPLVNIDSEFPYGFKLDHASHIGPRYADKLDNEDATDARCLSNLMAFALADGVGTAYGAGFAAKLLTEEVCNYSESLQPEDITNVPEVMLDAIRRAQASLTSHLKKSLEASAEDPIHARIRGHSRTTPGVARRLLENTLKPDKHWAMAMSSTLLFGIALPGQRPGTLEVIVLRIGDGVLEIDDSNGPSEKLLATDSSEKSIQSFVSAGPLGVKGLDSCDTVRLTLQPTQRMILSSDGLIRGHRESVSKMLRRFETRNTSLRAKELLASAADRADELFDADTKQAILDDNLSVILLTGPKFAERCDE